MAALLLKTPALMLSQQEADKLSLAINNLLAQYDIQLSARLMAWGGLAFVGSAIYGPRTLAIVMSKKMGMAPAGSAERSQHTSAAAAGAGRMDFSKDVKH